jgi:hypothetical protein
MITPEKYAKANTEHAHQVALFMWAAQAKQLEPRLKWLHAIPNGGLRDIRVAARLKAEGVKKGVADVFLPHPVETFGGMYCGLYIELKRIKSRNRAEGVESDKQNEFKIDMRKAGYKVETCYGWLDSVAEICNYLSVTAVSITPQIFKANLNG